MCSASARMDGVFNRGNQVHGQQQPLAGSVAVFATTLLHDSVGVGSTVSLSLPYGDVATSRHRPGRRDVHYRCGPPPS
ncbi:globin family protein [Streptomyces misionensis]|uniref:hypothetical protein n=1 Tax=Streptomyces misionensis TaxID=67331 RepID=UPI0036BF09E9